MNYLLYADDTQLYLPFQSSVVHEAEAAKVKLEACIQDIIMSGCHPTCSNSHKTELLVLNAKRRLWPPTTFVLVCDDIIMPSIRARNIGVVFDLFLSLERHIRKLSKLHVLFHLCNVSRDPRSPKSTEITGSCIDYLQHWLL